MAAEPAIQRMIQFRWETWQRLDRLDKELGGRQKWKVVNDALERYLAELEHERSRDVHGG